MAIIKSVRGFDPKIGKNTFLAENATIIGDVTIGEDCSIWFGAVLRGDVNTITLGDRVNIQDGAVIHTLYKRSLWRRPASLLNITQVPIGDTEVFRGIPEV